MKKFLLLLCFIFGTYIFTNAQVPGCATLTTPSNSATNVPLTTSTNNVTLSWTAPTTGGTPTGYKIRYGTTIAGLTVLGTTPNLTVNITNNLPNTTYYWQALPTNASGDATGCTIFSFTTGAAAIPLTPTCLIGDLYPSATYTPMTCDGTTINTIVSDAWAGEYSNINVVAGQTYKFQSSIATDFIKISTTAAPTAIAASGTTPVTWTATATEVIRFYIHTNNICGTQNTSRIRSIVCGSALTVDSFNSSIFSIAPNPADDFVNISNTAKINIQSVVMVDVNGRIVKMAEYNNVSDIQINISDLSAGMYLMNITSDQGTATKKIIKN
jgi:hypothetical protein